MSMTAKLSLLNLIIFIAFGIITGVMTLAFHNLEALTVSFIDEDVNHVIQDTKLAGDVSDLFNRTSLLTRTFYKHRDILETEGGQISEKTRQLLRQGTNGKLEENLRNFESHLILVLEQCAVINDVSQEVRTVNESLMTYFTKLEEMISEDMLLLNMAGEKVSDLQQSLSLVYLCRELLIRTTLQISTLEPMYRETDDLENIIVVLADLHLRIRSLRSSDSEISHFLSKLLEGVQDYKEKLIRFSKVRADLHQKLKKLDGTKESTKAEMELLRKSIETRFRNIRSDTSEMMRSSVRLVYVLAGLGILSLSIFVYFFFLLNIRKPMASVCEGLAAIGDGDMDARIQLGRSDEWCVIETAVNRMVTEVWNSYSELYRKNEELHAAHQKLRETQHYLRNIVDSMPSVMIGVDQDARITHWNIAAEKRIRTRPEEIKGQPVEAVYPCLIPQAGDIRNALSTRRPVKTEKQPRQQGDEIRYEDIMIYPLVTDKAEGAVIRMDDVTDRVRIEEMMIQTEKMMSVGGLAAGMAHEINNPLGIILQGVQNAFRRLSPDFDANIRVADECGTELDGIRHYLERRGIFRYLTGMQDAGNRAAEIVSNMLNFSRRSDSDMMTSVDMNALLDNAVELAASDYDLKKKYDFRQIEIIREYDAELPGVFCMATEIEQVFLNLLRNAAQAMPAKGQKAEISVITLRTCQEQRHTRIEIQDNGPGMDREVKSRIFEPFYTTKNVGVGTGLGLSVSFFIVTNNHNGTLSVESEPGSGAKFVIRLPIKAGIALQG